MTSMNIRSLLALAPVIPVLTIENVADAVPLGRALCAGGLRALEVTLRTPACLPAIEAMRKALPEAVVGVGTLTRPRDFARREQCRRAVRRQPGLDGGAGRRSRRRAVPAAARRDDADRAARGTRVGATTRSSCSRRSRPVA